MESEVLRLVGAQEIRGLLGVSRQRVCQLAERPDFPEPVAVLSRGRVWALADIEAWINARRTAERPRRHAT